jgi:hypothetical protein
MTSFGWKKDDSNFFSFADGDDDDDDDDDDENTRASCLFLLFS